MVTLEIIHSCLCWFSFRILGGRSEYVIICILYKYIFTFRLRSMVSCNRSWVGEGYSIWPRQTFQNSFLGDRFIARWQNNPNHAQFVKSNVRIFHMSGNCYRMVWRLPRILWRSKMSRWSFSTTLRIIIPIPALLMHYYVFICECTCWKFPVDFW